MISRQLVPERFTLAYSPEQIEDRLRDMGQMIGAWAEKVLRDTKAQPLGVCVLRGAAPFFTDLLRAIPVSIEPTFCRASSYSTETNLQSREGVRVSVDEVEAQGRALLVVDDICDTGATLHTLEKVFRELGAAEVKSAVLIHRTIPGSKYTPDWTAFQYSGADWFVGYGLDEKNWYRNLPAVYRINPGA